MEKLYIYIMCFFMGHFLVYVPLGVTAKIIAPKKPPVIEQVIEHYGSFDNIVDDYIPETKTIVEVVNEYPSSKEVVLVTNISKYHADRKTYFVKNDMTYTKSNSLQ